MKIRSRRQWTALLVLLWANSALAVQLLEVRDGAVVSARVSGNEPNRLRPVWVVFSSYSLTRSPP